MSLNLKKAAVVPVAAQERAKDAFSILAEVQDSVRRMGIPEYPRPEGSPPSLAEVDTGSLSNRELETFYSKYVAYAQYLGPKLAEAETAHKISQSNLKHLEATIKADLTAKQVPKTEHATQVKENAVYLENEIEDLKLFATKTILAAYYKAYANQAKAISRIIELRKLEQEQAVRQNSIGSYKPGGPPSGFRRPAR